MKSIGDVLTSASPEYESAYKTWNAARRSRPQEIILPSTAQEVQGAVLYARQRGLPLRIRSGGHSFDGYSSVEDGIVLNLSRLNSIELRGEDTVVIGPSARLRDINKYLGQHGLALPGGTCGGVGVAGLSLGGGIGLLGRSFGWLAQSIRSLDVVDANGNLLTVDSDNHPDLFWALRGSGGNNFGVVTSLTFQAHSVPSVIHGTFRWDWEHLLDVAEAFQNWLPGLNSKVNTTALLPLKDSGFVSIDVVSLLSQEETERAVAPLLAALPPILDQHYASLPYSESISDPAGPDAPEVVYSDQSRGTAVMGAIERPLSRDVLEKARDLLAVAKDATTTMYLFGMSGPQGVPAELNKNDPVSVPHLKALLVPHAAIYWNDPAEDDFNFKWMADFAKVVTPEFETIYINSHDIQLDDRIYPRYGESFARLVSVKNAYDPDNFFHFSASIPPSVSREEAARLGLPEEQIAAIDSYGLLTDS